VVRGRGDPLALATAVRREVASYAPSVPVAELQPMQALVTQAMAPTRFALLLIGIFALIAAILAGSASTACWRRRCGSAPRRSASG
jgi:hypothetical protein